jgi:hypothetical protein
VRVRLESADPKDRRDVRRVEGARLESKEASNANRLQETFPRIPSNELAVKDIARYDSVNFSIRGCSSGDLTQFLHNSYFRLPRRRNPTYSNVRLTPFGDDRERRLNVIEASCKASMMARINAVQMCPGGR